MWSWSWVFLFKVPTIYPEVMERHQSVIFVKQLPDSITFHNWQPPCASLVGPALGHELGPNGAGEMGRQSGPASFGLHP
jgi:hypothetical protein